MTTSGIESQKRVGQAGDRVGGAGAGGDQHGADLAGRARIALGGMHGALLVAHQDVLHLVLLEQRVVDRQHRAAGIAENVLDALIGKRRHHHFRAGHLRHGLLHSRPHLISFASGVVSRISENKKGAQEPLNCAPPRLAGGIIHPRRCAFATRTSERDDQSAHGRALASQVGFYKHCGRAGQGKCGWNLTPDRATRFKRAFEIDATAQNRCCHHS